MPDRTSAATAVAGASAGRGVELPRATPESQGIGSVALLDFVDRLEREGSEPHSLIVARHGAVVAEGWWAPYRPEQLQQLYSVSKVFTATAVGLAVDEGLVALDETLVDGFPGARGLAGPRASAVTLRNALTMTCGHREDSLPAIADRAGTPVAPSPEAGFFGYEPEDPPGQHFVYDNGAAIVAGALVQHRSGQRLVDYLRPRLFEPLGIEEAAWQRLPDGRDVGFSGLFLTTESVLRFGMLALAQGEWGGRTLVPTEWFAEATSALVGTPGHEHGPDWQEGYGFQFWRGQRGSVRAYGAYGQFCVVVPEQELVVVLMSSTADPQRAMDALWALVDGFSDTALDPDPETERRLRRRLAEACLPVRSSTAEPAPVPEWSFGRVGGDEVDTIRSVRLTADGQDWILTVDDDGQEIEVHCGDGRWPAVSAPYAATGGWTSPTVFESTVVAVETPHSFALRADVTTGGVAVTWTWHETPWCWRTLSRLSAPTGSSAPR